MKIYLYQQSFDISESNICEGRGKYLVLSCTKNADKFIKAECEKCRSIPEMTQRIPKIIGSLILKTVQHMLFVLNQEGVSTNAQKYLADVFNEKESVLQRICAELISRWQNSDRIGTFLLADASRELTDAALQDLESLWLGYFIAHGYSPRDEFYTHNKLKNALSELALLSVNKNSGSSHNKIGVQALQDAPYEHLIYKMVEEQIGHDKNLNFYKSIFANPFKPGTHKLHLKMTYPLFSCFFRSCPMDIHINKGYMKFNCDFIFGAFSTITGLAFFVALFNGFNAIKIAPANN